MKTKILLLAVLTAAIVYSCSSERDEEVQAPVSKKVDLEPLKTNNNQEQAVNVSDSIDLPNHVLSSPSSGLDPTNPTNPTDPNDPNEGDPKDVPPRK